MQLPLFSDIANYTKEMRIAKYSMRGNVCGHVLSPPLSISVRDANRQFFRNAWYTCAQLRYLVSHTWYTRAQLRYLVSHTSFGIDRLGGDHADGIIIVIYHINIPWYFEVLY